MKNIIIILGTRPEAIKLAPIILELKNNGKYHVTVLNTEQQKELSNQTLKFFDINADITLNIMQPNQSLSDLQARMLTKLNTIFDETTYDAAIVQGDTMSVFCGALAAFYHKVPVFHVEAGLRSFDLFEPFPEEAIRQMTSRICHFHFAPTEKAKQNLLQEGVKSNNVLVTGNTVIDALNCIPKIVQRQALQNLAIKGIEINDKLVLVTVHRRENHGTRLDNILIALADLAVKFSDHTFIVPVHPNPNVRGKVVDGLKKFANVILTEPLDYPELVCLMKNAKLILTDSGGIQEEAPTFGTPVLVMRYETERQEGVDAGFTKLVGADIDKITKETALVLSKDKVKIRISSVTNPYGDGNAAKRIVEVLDEFYKE